MDHQNRLYPDKVNAELTRTGLKSHPIEAAKTNRPDLAFLS